MTTFLSDIELKAQILHYGLKMTKVAQEVFCDNYLVKRRVYSNYDDDSYLTVDVPPEILFPNSGIVATAIFKNDSPWIIDYIDGGFRLKNNEHCQMASIDFIKKPLFYGKKIKNGNLVESYVTKLFGHSLGVFANTECFFCNQKKGCKFCSIASNKGRPNDSCLQYSVSDILEAIEIAVNFDDSINDIFISGGLFSGDFDKNFIFYSDLAISIKKLLLNLDRHIEVTLNTYPPKNLSLVDRLRDQGIVIMISLENVDDKTRAFICPGKSRLFNEIGIENILKKLVSVVGYGRVLAFLIQGIESDEVILEGVHRFAEWGVCAVVHILHVDPGTWFWEKKVPIPSPERIVNVAKEVSMIYSKYNLDTSIFYGGRSSLDGEASRGYI